MSFYVLCGGLVGLVKERKNAGRRPAAVLSLGCVVIINGEYCRFRYAS